MSARILHVLDPTTPADAVESLGALIRSDLETHDVAVLGHRSTGGLLHSAGIWCAQPAAAATTPATEATSVIGDIHWLPSMGWADPTGWRGLRRLVDRLEPTHVHAWGLPAAVAAAFAARDRPRIISLAALPQTIRPLILRLTERGSPGSGDVQWVGMWHWIVRKLIASGIPARRIQQIHPGVEAQDMPRASALPQCAQEAPQSDGRAQFDLLPGDGPILLLAGEGGEGGGGGERARHDYGLWVAGILQQIFPRVRALVREEQRGRTNHGLERLINDLQDGEIPVVTAADCSWDQLLAVADVLLVSADGPVSMGAALHAMAAGVPVVGTPVEAVLEVIEDGKNGLIAREIKPRAMAARVEELLGEDPAFRGLRERIVTGARQDIVKRFSIEPMVEAFRTMYGLEPANRMA
jgi:hypothetical protein